MTDRRLLRNARAPGWEAPRDILIADGKIAEVGAALDAPDASAIDLGGRAVLPGLVEAHTHLDKALTLDLCPNEEGTLAGAIREMAKLKKKSSPDEIFRRAEACLLKFLAHGSTVVRTHVDVDPTIELRGMEALVRLRDRYREKVNLQLVAFSSGASASVDPAAQRARLREAASMGADAVGGVPALADDAEAHLRTVFDVALEFGLPVDLHVDESDDPADLTLERVAEKTVAEGYEGRVIAGHCCSLAAVDDETARRVIRKAARAKIAVIAMPLCNLYLQGRRDPSPIRRGITRVKELLEAGVNVFCASDNVQDAFGPYGRGDTLEAAWLTGLTCQFDPGLISTLLEMVTERPARALGLDGRHGIRIGCPADLVVMAAESAENLVVERPARLMVLKAGRVVSTGPGAEGL
ncbi:MAG: amidohydrolase family protein, partial [Nitrospinota bacterium]